MMYARNRFDRLEQFDWAGLGEALGPLARSGDAGSVIERYRGDLCYLATPYTKIARKLDGSFCPVRSDGCAFEAAKWVALLAASGVTAISPIALAVAAVNADCGDALDPLDGAFWGAWCQPLLQACRVVVIPPIEGWRESAGIWGEAVAAARGLHPVHIITESEARAAW